MLKNDEDFPSQPRLGDNFQMFQINLLLIIKNPFFKACNMFCLHFTSQQQYKSKNIQYIYQ